jgi:hypothetical protein
MDDDVDDDESLATLDDLMSSGGGPGRGRPSSGMLVVASLAGIVVSVIALPRLVHWLFPLPWDILRWLAQVAMWFAGHA